MQPQGVTGFLFVTLSRSKRTPAQLAPAPECHRMLRLVQNPERLRRQPESRFRWISLAEDRETCRGAAQEGAESAHGTPSRTVPPRQRQRHAPRRKPADLVPERQLLQCNAQRPALLP